MNKSTKKKYTLFNLFSQNLEWVKEEPAISFEPDFSNGYICPLCFEVFHEKDLSTQSVNYLTLEDIPPVSLGGKPLALTCKNCNSTSGHKLDVHLLNNLLTTDAKMLLPKSKAETTFELNGNKMNGVLKVNEDGVVNLDLQPQRSNPNQTKQFMSDLILPRTIYNPFFHRNKLFDEEPITPPFNLQFKKTSNEKQAQVALLRIGYLIAFATLGNGFLINGGLFKVREQILNPNKEILPKVFWLKYNFPKENEGVNIIALPKKLQCFLIIFSLKTASQSRQFAIVLPGPSSPSIDVYDFIDKELCQGDGTEFCEISVEHINTDDILKKRSLTFASNWFWDEYTKEDYKPRLRPNTDTD
jgi:hypothetical protein